MGLVSTAVPVTTASFLLWVMSCCVAFFAVCIEQEAPMLLHIEQCRFYPTGSGGLAWFPHVDRRGICLRSACALEKHHA